jgi:gamma-glutamyltranspeptidase/glutathione hydrolase
MTKNQKKIISSFIIVIFIILVISFSKQITHLIEDLNQQTIKKNKPITIKSNYDNDDWEGEKYPEFKKNNKIEGQDFMVSSLDNRASEAGAKMLKMGGNAIDATIAAQMVLNVVEPQSSGIGGGAFLLYYDKKNNKSIYYNGRETAPAKSNDKMFLKKDGSVMEFQEAVNGGLSVGTPGLLKILKESHKKYGKLKWQTLFEPAIKIAENGFPMEDKIRTILKDVKYLENNPDLKELYFNLDGTIKKNGEIIYNKKLAKTLSIIAKQGIKPFYEGQIAKNIVKKVKKSDNPGYLSLLDLKKYRSSKGELICSYYHSYKICSMLPPSTGGITLLQILSILEPFRLDFFSPTDPITVHLISEAVKLAYQDRNKYIADVKNVPLKKLLNKKYLEERSDLIKPDKIIKDAKAGDFKLSSNYHINYNAFESNSTTHISVIDSEGNAVSMTSSIEYLFGSNLLVDGFMLNNQMTDFSFEPKINGKKVINRVRPKKQPRSSMTPTFVFDEDDNLILIVGSPGGPRIIQYVAKTIIAHLDWKMPIDKAIAMPNFIMLKDSLELEKGTYLEKLSKPLEEIGHNIKIKNISSGITAISIQENKIYGAADHRRNGAASGQ